VKTADVIGAAIANTFRSKLRTTLTVVAIFIGAFTLTITSGLGTGINAYINSTIASIGAGDILTVTKTPADTTGSGPQKYDASQVQNNALGQRPGGTVEALTPDDVTKLQGIAGVTAVQPSLSIRPDFIENGNGQAYKIAVTGAVPGLTVQLASGAQLNATTNQPQIVLADTFVKPLGFTSQADAIGKTVKIAITDADREQKVMPATVVGIAEAGLVSATGAATSNNALTQQLYAQASVRFDGTSTPAQVTALKDRLTAAGYTGRTVSDQIGTFKTVVDAIVLVLDAFAVIALIAAGFGIVNTLLMSVQERTKEIGLMKAMGMSSGKIFGLFSFEAVFIGFLGSAIGAGIGILVGTGISSALAHSVFSGLPGLNLIAFSPGSIIVIIVVIMAIAFVAGTLPASRAARQDPIDSLRYE
jgi:putative ABC transport system permease protein